MRPKRGRTELTEAHLGQLNNSNSGSQSCVNILTRTHGRRNFFAKFLIFNHEDGYGLGTVGSLNIQSDFIPADEDVSDGRCSHVG